MVSRARGTRRLTSCRACTVLPPTRNERRTPAAESTNGECRDGAELTLLPT